MEEVFVELIIKRRISFSGLALRFLSAFMVLIGVLSILRLGVLGLTITILLIYGAYLVWSYTSVEYEYSFLNGELTIDKILGQRKRKPADEFDIKKADLVAPTSSDEVIRRSAGTKILDYSSGYKSDKLYSIILNHQDYGNVQVIFEPDERILNAMYHVRPNIVKK